jgi:hypothetical protein
MSARRTALGALNAVEERPWAVAVFLVALYVLNVARPATRPLWFDELLTYHIARSSTWSHFTAGILRIDVNPPLQYILTAGALRLFGDSPLVTRLPSLVCFLIASLCLYRIALRRLGTWYAAVVVLLFWASRWFLLATEARPYGLLIACFAGAFLAWRRAVEGNNRTAALWCLFACVNGMLWSHCFGLFLLIPFGIAELARWRRRRKADWTVWMVFVASCALVLPLYLQLFSHYRAILEPPGFVTDWFNMVVIYAAVVVRPPVLATLLVSLLVALRPSVRKGAVPGALPDIERVFLGAVFLIPLCLEVMLVRNHGPFWPRYAVGYGFFASLVVGAALRRFARRDLVCAATAAVALAATVGYDAVGPEPEISTRPPFRQAAADPWYLRVRPDLPFVCAGGFTFVAMNHRESDRFLARVYYLTDPEAAQLAHATLFEIFPFSIPYMGGKAHVEQYRAFTREHRRFLVLAQVGYPEDWLLPKLLADGAVFTKLDQRETGYMDQTLFDVTLPEGPEN